MYGIPSPLPSRQQLSSFTWPPSISIRLAFRQHLPIHNRSRFVSFSHIYNSLKLGDKKGSSYRLLLRLLFTVNVTIVASEWQALLLWSLWDATELCATFGSKVKFLNQQSFLIIEKSAAGIWRIFQPTSWKLKMNLNRSILKRAKFRT